MAESQIAGLFMTPEMYRQQKMQADRMRAMEYARLAPEERAAMGFFSAGQGLGRAAGTLLGAQDPQLQRITEQQQLLQGLDVANPESLMEAARRASQSGNMPLAMQLAGRAQEIGANAALIAQRERSNNPLQALIASGKYTPASISAFAQSGNPTDLVLATPERQPQSFGPDREAISLELFDKPYVNLTTEERTQVNAAIRKPAATPSFGAEAERVSRQLYWKGYAELTQPEMAEVNKQVDARAVTTAAATAPRVVVQNPTTVPRNIATLRRDVQQTIDPQLKVVTATDQALEQLDLSLKKNNPIAFNAARVQLARAIGGGGDLALREIQNAGGDPSLAGRIIDTTSTLITGTPSQALQNQIKATLRAFRTVAINKARAELDTQRALALQQGAELSYVDRALNFSELNRRKPPPAPAAPTGGSSAPSNTFLGAVRQSGRQPQQATAPAQPSIPDLLNKYAPQP